MFSQERVERAVDGHRPPVAIHDQDALGHLIDGVAQPQVPLGLAHIHARRLDRDAGPRRQHDDQPLVLLRELHGPALVGQVQVAGRTPAIANRNAQEAGHRRMAGGEAVEGRVPPYVGRPQHVARTRDLPQRADGAGMPAQSPRDVGRHADRDPRFEGLLRIRADP